MTVGWTAEPPQPLNGLVLGDIVHSRATVEANVGRAAGAIAAAGVRAGDRVAFLLRNDISVIEASLATARLGAVAVPMNWHAKEDDVEFILRDCGARLLIAHRDLFDRVGHRVPSEVVRVVIDPSAPVARAHGLSSNSICARWEEWIAEYPAIPAPGEAAIPGMAANVFQNTLSYTSGTTGSPKGVVRRRTSAPSGSELNQSVSSRPGTRHLVTGPLYHAAPNAAALNVIEAQGLVVLQPKFDAGELLALIERHRINHLMMVPTMFVRLLDLPGDVRKHHDVSSIQFAIHGAGPCPPSVKKAMIDWWGPVIYEYYGGTEAGMATFCSSEDALAHPGTVGRPLPGVSVRILDEAGLTVTAGTVGEIFIKNGNMPEFDYIGDAVAARGEVVRDGYVTQGDLGYFDGQGFLYLAGRKREMIVSGGVNIYTIEIESALADMPGVRLAAAFAVPDEEYGEAVGVAVELDGTHHVDSDAVRAYLRSRLGRLKEPRVVEFRSRISANDAGKISKLEFTRKYWAHSPYP
ncbi:hypothetical protein A5761_09785 [Mycolicibacterium setense]|uniref:AMP-binding protein n=1 Tax=Mycolicibacterium setense TaxID=431269 RepID=UPI0007E9E40A|nr:AMP-binding protein [Mycolicibacterium setense]OBB17640.1 hypothetical protein A5761_09785 [Mycolicibacterium setense]